MYDNLVSLMLRVHTEGSFFLEHRLTAVRLRHPPEVPFSLTLCIPSSETQAVVPIFCHTFVVPLLLIATNEWRMTKLCGPVQYSS